jgi:hypothetical protein
MPSILDDIAAAEDVQEELLNVAGWGVDILFRGMSYAALSAIQAQGIDLEAAQAGDMDQAIRLIMATACDPESKELIFNSERGEGILRSKGFENVMFCLNKGTLVVLGVDEAETAGKDSSSTVTEAKATD